MSVVFQLNASDGTTPVFTFPIVFSANYPNSTLKTIQHSNLRGKGSIIIDGGSESFTITLKGVLSSTNYTALTSLITTMESTVALNTPYYLTITGGFSYKVKRITPIKYEETNLRTNYVEYEISFLADCW